MTFAMVSLSKHPRSGNWTARKAIPADIRKAYGRWEEKKTWPVALSKGQAKAELAAWLAPIEERIALLRASATQALLELTQRQSHALAGEWYRAQVARFEDNPGQPENWWFTREELEPDDPEERETGRIRLTAWLIAERDALLQSKGLAVRPACAERLLQDMGDLWISLCDLMEKRAEGDYGPDPLEGTLPVFEEASPRKAPAAVSISDLFADYEALGIAAPSTIKKWRPIIGKFTDFLGHDDATRVTVTEVTAWVRSLQDKGLSAKSMRDG